jgi:hypothetical protein
MEAIRMVLVTLALVTAGVLGLALVAHLAARTGRRSTGRQPLGSLGDRPDALSVGKGTEGRADDRGAVGARAARITRCGNAAPAELDRRDGATARTWRNPRGFGKAATNEQPHLRHHATDGPWVSGWWV